jgi:hypothetical protein
MGWLGGCKDFLWIGFISINALLFKTFYEIALIPFLAPQIIDTPAMYLTSTIAGVAWALFLYIAFRLKFRSGGEK